MKDKLREILEKHNRHLHFSSSVYVYPQDSEKIIKWLDKGNEHTVSSILTLFKEIVPKKKETQYGAGNAIPVPVEMDDVINVVNLGYNSCIDDILGRK